MQTLQLSLDKQIRQVPYFIGNTLWQSLATFLSENFPSHAIYGFADEMIAEIYREIFEKALQSQPRFQRLVTFPAGEASKSRRQKDELEDLLLGEQAGRDTVLIAMGGGVTGDLVGFVAASLHRSVPLIHLPTSLLAQVDSSIGGKVGINHSSGKNLLGAFYHPAAVFCDIDFIASLPEADFLSGMAEVIKYAVTLDEELYGWLENESEAILRRDPEPLRRIIQRSVALKIAVVEADEKESNYRSILNFGHTIGHAIEKLSNFQVKHGFGVAEGMRHAAVLSHRLLEYPLKAVERLEKLLTIYDLNRVQAKDYPFEAIWTAICSDKKARLREPRFTLMKAPGEPALFQPVQKQELYHVIAS